LIPIKQGIKHSRVQSQGNLSQKFETIGAHRGIFAQINIAQTPNSITADINLQVALCSFDPLTGVKQNLAEKDTQARENLLSTLSSFSRSDVKVE
jgi:hypothetical protein